MKAKKILVLVGLATVAAIALFPYTTTPTGNTKVVSESVCSKSYTTGVGGTSRKVCSEYKSVSVTRTEYNMTNLVGFKSTGWR